MQTFEELCCYYVSFLRAITLVHKNNHWVVKGGKAYGDHLMLDRIYGTAVDNVDLIAEKFVGLFGVECLNLTMQAEMIKHKLEEYASLDPIQGSLKIEEDFLKFAEEFFKKAKEENKMTLGLDDSLMSISSTREEAVYLLKQATSEALLTSSDSPVTARLNFWRKLIKA